MDYPPVTDFAALHTEFHSHLIPGIDDGVKTLDESVQMIREMHALGFKPGFQVLAGIGAEFDEHFSFQHVDEHALRMSEPSSLHALR